MTAMSRWFHRYYDRLMEPLERRRFLTIRTSLLSCAKGEVLEIGSGTGINFPLYRDVHVTAVEPSALMREQSTARVRQASVPITVIPGTAERLPFEPDVFDTVVGTLVLCTVPDAVQAVREMKRVCRPGGTLLLFEHVRLDHPVWGRLQDALTPAWKRLCDGCHLNRDTMRLLRSEGLDIVKTQSCMGHIFIAVEAVKRAD
ncbi:class I SAM-dependent methyltransferase [Paenibacillus allorhizosphaerae]|uniref:2-methoxy-6-polyprenyl-1,4-benzoquinol methylase, mitochondrial n=1 Tax=Paenibacillus allorhizosphaerae TaxID=2849866 RepID=A0ABM8VJK1_9BACL|nr:class I SAM-dependent methyltransferase [Paenibacillus allorhizosphaerae]CAG7645604.1 2-methoxy-6-polyprenyl-1,4-benzoquinol methylase, mitochondrial [Paenibacillus allorhizosphaerae]